MPNYPTSGDIRYYSRAEILALLSLKADKVKNATEGNFVLLNEEGNIYDSGFNMSNLIFGSFLTWVDGGTF